MGSRLRMRHLVALCASIVLVLVGTLVAGFAVGSSVARPGEDPATRGLGHAPFPTLDSGVSLRGLAEDRELRVGTAVNVDALANQTYSSTLANEFNAVTAENAMKWSAVEPSPGEFDRSAADAMIAFAGEHDQEVYGHTLVWHKQIPDWVRDNPMSDSQLRSVLQTHIQAEVGHFQGEVWAWDVVNEAFEEDGSFRDSLWLNRLGPGYIADSFHWARAVDPDASLYINDYGIEGINAKSNALYQLVAQFVADGVPIDGIGFQLHWTLDPLPSSFADNLRRFAALGLEVSITELDVRIPEPITADKLDQQAEIYAQATGVCLEVPECVSLTVWGFTDAHSWVPEVYPGSGGAALFDEKFTAKPAYHAVAHTLRQYW